MPQPRGFGGQPMMGQPPLRYGGAPMNLQAILQNFLRQQNPTSRIDPNTYTRPPSGIAGGGPGLDSNSPQYAQALQQFNAMQGQQVGNTGQQAGPPAQGGIAPGAFAIAGDPRNYAKGGFAVKPVWDKKRPKDLDEPKSLSVKKKKSAKARAAAAGRPYPNLVDNMAAARKKGK